MAQRFVLKSRSRDADGHKETSHMIRDPRQRAASAQFDAKKKTSKSKLVKMNAKRQSRGKALSLDDRGVKTRMMKRALATGKPKAK